MVDSGQAPQSILETLRTVEFRLGLKGYNVDEVDEYLEKAAVEAERLQEQLRQALDRLRQATERIAQLEAEQRSGAGRSSQTDTEIVQDDTLQRTLLLAQRFVEQTKRESEAEAAETIAQAEARARAIVARAEEDARRLVSESQQALREEVTRLETARGQLAGDVENMARHLEAERNRLRTMLADVLRWVDENIQPAEALMALRPRPAGEAVAQEDSTEQAPGSQVRQRSQGQPGAGGDAPTDAVPGNPGPTRGDERAIAEVLDLTGARPSVVPSEPRH